MGDHVADDYIVTTFASKSIGPLNKRQAKIRDHFVRTMEFLGLADVNIDTLIKEQRDEILALAAKRRKEIDASNNTINPVVQPMSNNKERMAAPNKRRWDIRHNLNIKLYKAIETLGLNVSDVELLTQKQRAIIYAELKRREKAAKSANPMESAFPSQEYEELENIYTSKPVSSIDISSVLKLVAKTPALAKRPTKAKFRYPRRNSEPTGVSPKPQNRPEVKPAIKGARNSAALCPNPYKKTFATQELALTFIEKAHPNDKEIAPYQCSCGAIHIGH